MRGRLYDPRVLRIYLPTCNAAETQEFFGPVSRFLMEASDPQLMLQFVPGSSGAEQKASAVRAWAGSA
jgi:hypothetical protein